MIKRYKICDLSVECDFRFDTMINRAEKFLWDDMQTQKSAEGETGETSNDRPNDFSEGSQIRIEYDKEYHERLLKDAPHFTEKDCEVMVTGQKFYNQLLDYNGFMLHSSAVMVDGKVYLFSASSGTGKSTHTRQWLKLFGERAVIINDDKPAIRMVDSEIYAYGTPWSGSSDRNKAACGKLQGICVLERSPENFIEPLDRGDAIFKILNQTIRPTDTKRMDKLLTLLDSVIVNVPVWRMGCNISTDAAKLAYETMSR